MRFLHMLFLNVKTRTLPYCCAKLPVVVSLGKKERNDGQKEGGPYRPEVPLISKDAVSSDEHHWDEYDLAWPGPVGLPGLLNGLGAVAVPKYLLLLVR